MTIATCGSCRFYRKLVGECRHKSPDTFAFPVQKAPGVVEVARQAVFPPMDSSEIACGDYQPEVKLDV